MKRAIGTILFVLYSIVAIAVTVLLLSFNEYNCSEIGGYTVYLVNDDSLEPDYKEGSILLIKETSDKHIKEGDELFFYKVINSQEYEFVNKTLTGKTQQGRHILYSVDSGEAFADEYIVGKADDTIVIEGWGVLLSILESKWGYLFCIVIVSLLLFLQEVFELIIEIKYGGTKGTKAANTAHARKNAGKKSTTTKTAGAKATGAKTAGKVAAATTTKKVATAGGKTEGTSKVATAAKTVATAAKVNSTETKVEEEG